MLLKKKGHEWIFITGATSGIGRRTAEYLATKGYRVIATGRNQQALEELQAVAKKNEWHLHAWKLDVTNDDDIKRSVSRALDLTQGQGIDVLINNAGYGQPGFLLDLTSTVIRRQFDVNVFGLLEVTKAFAPQLIQKRGSKIINVSSVLGKMPVPWLGIYTASKFAVEAISDVLRHELHPFGVKVIVVEPGAIATSFQERTIEQLRAVNQQHTPYRPIYQWLEQTRYKALYTMPSGSPAAIAKTIHSVIQKKNPKNRYVVPLRARLFLRMYQLLPNWLVDRITRRTFHLHQSLVFHDPVDKTKD